MVGVCDELESDFNLLLNNSESNTVLTMQNT